MFLIGIDNITRTNEVWEYIKASMEMNDYNEFLKNMRNLGLKFFKHALPRLVEMQKEQSEYNYKNLEKYIEEDDYDKFSDGGYRTIEICSECQGHGYIDWRSIVRYC
jgi:ribonucleotide reductase alpha subunit